jgi:hypothetical protein
MRKLISIFALLAICSVLHAQTATRPKVATVSRLTLIQNDQGKIPALVNFFDVQCSYSLLSTKLNEYKFKVDETEHDILIREYFPGGKSVRIVFQHGM